MRISDWSSRRVLFRSRCRGAFLERDEGLGPLAGIGIGNTDDERLLDCLMLVEDRLDLAREDLEAADGDHVLQAINDADIAVLADEADIPRATASADEHLRIRFRAVPIALHALRPVDDDLVRPALRAGLPRTPLAHPAATAPR